MRAALLLACLAPATGQDGPLFAYDEVDELREPQWHAGPEAYDADLSFAGAEPDWVHVLHDARGELLVGASPNAPASLADPRGEHVTSRNPTLTPGLSWVHCTREVQAEDGGWRIELQFLRRTISSPAGNALDHRAACDPRGGVWYVFQQECAGQYDVRLRHARMPEPFDEGAPFLEGASLGPTLAVADTPAGEWHPDVTCTPGGDLCVVWDAYDGESFDVLARWRVDGEWRAPLVVASGPAFQGRARVESDSRGRVWVLWEEGAEGWGHLFRGQPGTWTNVTDRHGPLHRFRTLHVAELRPEGARLDVVPPLPMPALARGAARADRRPGVSRLGIYYERGELAVDASDRVWVAYRHFYAPQTGQTGATKHHAEQGWRIHARPLTGDGWGPVTAFHGHQRDGGQRLTVRPHATGIALAWTAGRTDRREDPARRGVAWATIDPGPGPAADPALVEAPARAPFTPAARPAAPVPATVGEATRRLYFGDLHRHTDLSLCFPFYDGSLDDAYRYGIEVAALDFLAVTDHCRDLARGDVASQLWARSTKEVTRHRLAGRFVPLFAFERSHGDTDHNVITLDPGVLENFPPPLTEFWSRIDPARTITLPHQPYIGKVWATQDDARRPLAEVYQGCRDDEVTADVHRGLAKGYHLGFVAASDHLSTSASYACVWADELTDVALFEGLAARRTFGATARMRVLFACGEAWMGERVALEGAPTYRIEVDAGAPLKSVTLVRDGAPVAHLPLEPGASSLRAEWTDPEAPTRETWTYLAVARRDGERAWSSPIWVRPRE